MNFFRFVKSDFIKLKRTNMLLIHFLAPAVGIAVFLGYYEYSSVNPISKVSNFLMVAAFIFPVLISVICSMVVDQEALAGNFQQMLNCEIKPLPFFSKLVVVNLMGVIAVLFLICGFGLGFIHILNKTTFGLSYYLCTALILFSSSIFIYILHIIISLKFGGIQSISVGAAEGLLSVLFDTGLGDGRWQFVPCTWGTRFLSAFNKFMLKETSSSKNISELHLAILLCITSTIAIIVLGTIWFNHWEGRKIESN
ncbi:lantibiotic immunity ABC transporter MutG family permease subunit [Clostridium hydrogenum]|uniref:lantibiotic immunity ABC transporter MutG family permease subunit n=1 Tax=Clostridium hydrogenum TaxID=2855764 RepID=UPI001F2C0DE3|nr:lantibiotic immunity ABC transporter MutG family permease subunit [Clostridium hydrogenum]